MISDISTFLFDSLLANMDEESDFIARIPPGIKSREKLFGALRHQLRLPDYFGENWDALSDCLRDLSWIKARRVIVAHEDLPPLDSASLFSYLDVLADAVQDWKPDENHELVVIFPKTAQAAATRVVHNGPYESR